MQRLTYLALGIILSACAPNRPPLNICFFATEDMSAHCTDPKGVDFVVPATEMNKWFTLNEVDTQKLLDYVLQLEKKAAGKR